MAFARRVAMKKAAATKRGGSGKKVAMKVMKKAAPKKLGRPKMIMKVAKVAMKKAVAGKSRGSEGGKAKAKAADINAKAALITKTLAEAEHIPASVRDMLVKMAGYSLDSYEEARHDFQKQAITMIGEALVGCEQRMEASVKAAEERVAAADGEAGTCEAAVTEALSKHDALKATVAEQQAAFREAEQSLQEAQEEKDARGRDLRELGTETSAARKAAAQAQKRLDRLSAGAISAFEELRTRAPPVAEEDEPMEDAAAGVGEGAAAAAEEAGAGAAETAGVDAD